MCFTITLALSVDQIQLLMDDCFDDCSAEFLAGQLLEILSVRFGSAR